MAITVPALRGKMGETEFFQATMKVSDLVRGARTAKELDEWSTQSIDERLQREPDLKRIEKEIAPYIAKSRDRFFGSMIVLVYKGEIGFESLTELTGDKLPRAYKSAADSIGFVTIDGGELVVLDGQHRMRALRGIVQGDFDGQDDDEPWLFAGDIANDEVSVLFINHESNEKTRRIFNKVNRYAKATSRGDNIITSEDDAYAVVTRRLLDFGEPLGPVMGSSGKPKDIVNWRSNTLSANSTNFTTISAVYESVKAILTANGVTKLSDNDRPRPSDIGRYIEIVKPYWSAVVEGLQPYQEALADPALLPEMRKSEGAWSLLFKPAAQIAFFKGLAEATRLGVDLEQAVDAANDIDWGMLSPIWRDILVKSSGSMDASGEAVDRAARLITYLLASHKLEPGEIKELREQYNIARGYKYGEDPVDQEEDLPKPVVITGV